MGQEHLSRDLAEHVGTLRRLQAAGIVLDFGGAGDERWVHYTPDYLELLAANVNVMSEPGFVEAWSTGDPSRVKAWISDRVERLRSQR